MTVLLICLYVLAAILEIAGVLLVIAEMRSDRKRALEIAGIEIPTHSYAADVMDNWPTGYKWSIQSTRP